MVGIREKHMREVVEMSDLRHIVSLLFENFCM